MQAELTDQILDLPPGAHLCLLYDRDPQEQMPALIPFIQEGLSKNEQFVYVADDHTVDELADVLRQHGIDLETESNKGRLKLWSRNEWREPGELNTEQKIQQVRRIVQQAVDSGFKGIRFAVEMTWTLGPDINVRQLEHWEAAINTLFNSSFPGRIICQYNRSRLAQDVLMAALHTHPQAILGGEICSNFFCHDERVLKGHSHLNAPSEDIKDITSAAERVNWMISRLKQGRTAERQNQERLREELERRKENNYTNQQLAAIVQSSDDAIISQDSNSIIISWNSGAERIFGYTAREAIGKSITMLIPSDRENEEPDILKRICNGERIDHYLTVRRRKDGSLIDVSLSVSPLKDATGKIIGASKTTREITRQKQIEETLQQRTKSLEILNRIAEKLISERDLEPLILSVVDAGRELSGAEFGSFFYNVKNEQGESYTLYTPSGVPREAFAKIPMPRNTALFGPTFRGERVIRIGDVLQDPRYGKSAPHHGMPKGHLPVRSYLAVPVFSRSGEVLGGLFYGHSAPNIFTSESEATLRTLASQAGMAVDNANLYSTLHRELADQKRAQQSSQLLASIVESSDDAIISKDLNGIITSWNAGAQKLFGYTAAEAIGQPITIVFPAERLNEEEGILARIRRGERIDHYETIRQHKDGTRIDISLTASPIKDADGRIIGASKIARDIRERRQAEEALQEANEKLARANQELESRVSERTASLQQALSQMEEFSYSVSHDLRAPVRAMQGYARVLMEDFSAQLGQKGTDYLDRIMRSGVRMDRLIQEVLTFSRLARTEIELKPVSLEKLLPDIVHAYPQLQPPHAEIIIKHPLLMMHGHEPSLTQAISNLLNNAAKFVAPGVKPKIHLWTEQSGDRVRLWIEDNGIGIKPDYQARLFGLFQRIHGETIYEGTGIGLAIVRKAADRMGGKAGCVSDGVSGSKFWIELKAVQ